MRLADCKELVISGHEIYDIIAASIGVYNEWTSYYEADRDPNEICELDLENKRMVFSRNQSYHGSPSYVEYGTMELSDDKIDKLSRLSEIYKITAGMEFKSIILKFHDGDLNSIIQI